MQYRSGAGIDAGWSTALAAGVGVRFWIGDCRIHFADGEMTKTEASGVICMSFGYEVRYQQDLDSYLFFGGVLPRGSGVLMSDISIGLEF
jgi:hypothetical protein